MEMLAFQMNMPVWEKEKVTGIMPEAVNELVGAHLLRQLSSMKSGATKCHVLCPWLEGLSSCESSLDAQSSLDQSQDWEVSDLVGRTTTPGTYHFFVVFIYFFFFF